MSAKAVPHWKSQEISMAKEKEDDQYSEQEIVKRRDAVIKRMLATPPKPHSEMKIGTRRRLKANKQKKNK
jgi:hypothetical protein